MASDGTIDYQSEIEVFHQLRNANIRYEAQDIGGRQFILVSNVTEALLRPCPRFHDKLTRLLWAAYNNQIENQMPQNKTGQLHDHLPVFYTLLDLDLGHRIHEFLDDNLKDLPIEKEKLKRVLVDDDLVQKFYDQQWRWCPMKFDWRMYGKIEFKEYIVPIEARTRIEPSREGLPKSDRKATLWAVEVPTELVDEPLKEKLKPRGDISYQNNPLKVSHHRFVVKQFPANKEPSFDNEKGIFNALGEKEGLVKYIGWYENYEKKSGNWETCYNLVLELGDQDLYSTFQKENPPVAATEIKEFWQSMFEVAEALASLQTQEPFGMTFHVWHGDVKPENILSVGNRFKIADPGEAKMVRAVPNVVPTTEVPGGTRTFAAPEKLIYHADGRTQECAVTQGSDVWSLGCVFSVAATYVVLGKEGVKRYRLLRNRATERLGLGLGDPFHNQREVLPEVSKWHIYLRQTLRKSDCYTSKVLDIVDQKMLIVPGESRIPGKDLARELERLLETVENTDQNIPSEITEILEDTLGSEQQTISPLTEVPRTISQSGEEPLFREPVLYSSRRSEGRTPSFKSHGQESLRLTNSNSESSSVHPVRASSSSHSDMSKYQAPTTQGLSELAIPPDNPDSMGSGRSVTTLYKLEADLNKHGRGPLWRKKSVKGKLVGEEGDLLETLFQNRDIVFLVDNGSSMADFWDQASRFVRVLAWRALNYDDDGIELKFTHGKEDFNLKPRKHQNVGEFVAKMKKARPSPGATVRTDMKVNLACICDKHMRDHPTLDRKLTVLVFTDGVWEGMNNESEVDRYFVDVLLKINEIVEPSLTEATSPVNMVRSYTTTKDRPITAQFIQFGHDDKATKRLYRLDNGLKGLQELAGKHIVDIVDTEHANGDAYKMLRGSLSDDFDNIITPGTPAISPPHSNGKFPMAMHKSQTSNHSIGDLGSDQYEMSNQTRPQKVTNPHNDDHRITSLE